MSSDQAAAQLFHNIPNDEGAAAVPAAQPRRPRLRRGKSTPAVIAPTRRRVRQGRERTRRQRERIRQALIARRARFEQDGAAAGAAARAATHGERMVAAHEAAMAARAQQRGPPTSFRPHLSALTRYQPGTIPKIRETVAGGELRVFPEVSPQERAEERAHNDWMILKNTEEQNRLRDQLRFAPGPEQDNIEQTLNETRKKAEIFAKGTIRDDKERRLAEFNALPEGPAKEQLRQMLLNAEEQPTKVDSRRYKGGKTRRRKRKRRRKTRKRKRRGKTRKRKRRGKRRKKRKKTLRRGKR